MAPFMTTRWCLSHLQLLLLLNSTTFYLTSMASAENQGISSSSAYEIQNEAMPTAFYCPSAGLFADDFDCQIYYRCETKTNDYIKPYMLACKDGTVFSRDLKLCMPPTIAGRDECLHYMNEIDTSAASVDVAMPDNIGGDDSHLMYDGIASNGNAMLFNGPLKNYGLNGLSGVSVISFSTSSSRSAGNDAEDGPPCEDDGFMSDHNDCTVFYRCISNGNNFNKIGFRCSDGTAWDESLQSCNYINNVRANGGCQFRADKNTNEQSSTQSQSSSHNSTSSSSMSSQQQSSSNSSSSQSSSSQTSNSSSSSNNQQSSSSSSSNHSNNQSENSNSNQQSAGSNNNQQATGSNNSNQQGTTSTNNSQQAASSSNSNSNNIQSPFGQSEAPECIDDEIYFPDANDCAKFYRCRDNGNGKLEKVPFICGPGTVWNQNDKACDLPTEDQKKKCKISSLSNEGSQQSQSQESSSSSSQNQQSSGNNQSNQSSSNSQNSTSSASNQSSNNETSSSQQSSSSENSSNSSNNNNGTQAYNNQKPINPDGQCKDNETYLPDKTDCARFYRCVDNGNGGYDIVPFDCAPGTIWDADCKGCNHPTDVQKEKCKAMTSGMGSSIGSTSSTNNNNNSVSNSSSNQSSSSSSQNSNNNNQSSSSSGNQSSSTSNNQSSSSSGNQSSSSSTNQSSSSNNQNQGGSSTASSSNGSSNNQNNQNQQGSSSQASSSNQSSSENSNNQSQTGSSNQSNASNNTSQSSGSQTSSSSQQASNNNSTSQQSTTSNQNGSSSSGSQSSSSQKPFKPADHCIDETTFLSDKENCSRFYRCVNNGKGGFMQVSFNCPANTVWDPEANSCNHAFAVQNLNCKMSTSTGTSTQGSSQNSGIQSSSQQTGSNQSSGSSESNQGSNSGQQSGSSSSNNQSSSTSSNSQSGSNQSSGSQASSSSQSNQGSNSSQQSGSSSSQQSGSSSSNNQNSSISSNSQSGSNQSSGSQTSSNSQSNQGSNSSQQSGSSSSQQSGSSSSNNQSSSTSSNSQSGSNQGSGSQTSSGSQSNHGSSSSQQSSSSSSQQSGSSSSTNQSSSSSSSSSVQSSSSQSSNMPAGECNASTQFLGDQKDCAKFYRCVDNGKGSYDKVTFTCGPGTVWDSQIDACNHAWAVKGKNCGMQQQTKPTTQPPSNQGTKPPFTQKPSGPPPQTKPTTQRPSATDGICRQDGFIGDPKDCSIFYRCVSNGKGGFIQYPFKCGDGTVWDNDLQTCNHDTKMCNTLSGSGTTSTWQETTTTITPTASSQKPTEKPQSPGYEPTTTTSKYPTTTTLRPPTVSSQRPTEKPRPPGYEPTTTTSNYPTITASKPGYPTTTMNPESTTGKNPGDPNTTSSPTATTSTMAPIIPEKPISSGTPCSKEGFFGDEQNCQVFYRCVDNGKGGFEKHMFKCGNNTVWDPTIEGCNHPTAVEDSRCWVENATSTADGETTTYNPITNRPSTPTRPTTSITESTTLIVESTTDGNRPATTSSSIPATDFTTTMSPTSTTPIPNLPPGTKCTDEGFMADPKNCRKFYRCIRNGDSFSKHEFECAKGTGWSEDKQTCDYAANIERCAGQTDKPNISTTTSPFESTTKITTVYPTKPTAKPIPTTTAETTTEPATWKPKPITTEMSTPYPTKPTTEGTAETTTWRPKPTTTEISSTSPTKPTNGETTEATTWKPKPTDYPTTVSPTSTTPIPNLQAGTKCQGEGFMADPQNCRKFYRCIRNGDSFSRHEFECARGTGWSEEKQTCDHAANIERCAGQTERPDESTSTPSYESITTLKPQTTTYPTKPTTEIVESTTSRPKPTATDLPTTYPTKPIMETTWKPKPTDTPWTTQPTKPTTETTWKPKPTMTTETSTTYPTPSTPNYPTSGQPGYPPTTGNPETTSTEENLPTTTNEPINHECSMEGFFPDRDDCNRYYRCVDTNKNGNYQVYSFRCPKGTVWDTSLETCNHAENVASNCSSGATTTMYPNTTTSTPLPTATSTTLASTETTTISVTNKPTETTQKPFETTTNKPVETTTISKPTAEETSTSQNGTSLPCPATTGDQSLYVCPTGFRRHPRDCSLFYQCTFKPNSNDMSIITLACPNNTVYHEEQNLCDTPSKNENCLQQSMKRFDFEEEDIRRSKAIQIRKTASLCPYKGYFALNDEKCGQLFIKCAYSQETGKLEGTINQCPQGKAFWNDSRRCEWRRQCEKISPIAYA